MIFNKRGKCISITKSEYEDIKFIYNTSSCLMEAANKTRSYLFKSNYLKEDNPFNYIDNKISFELVQAVIYNYKYMKVED